jgi:pimeloyl-ACP methyl ester carboxylesterase
LGRGRRACLVGLCQGVRARIANSRIEIIKDCGHVPQVEQLEVLAPIVAKFLDS